MIGQRPKHEVIGGIPRVDLMPPEVAQRRLDRRRQGWSIVAVIVVLGLAVVGTGLAAFANTIAQANLVNAQAQTSALLAQQQEYAEVSELRSSIALAEQATVAGTASEVLWLDVQRELLGVLPTGSSVTTMAGTGDVPWTISMLPEGPLREPRVATFRLSVTTSTIDELVAYIRSLEGLDIVADVTADSTQISAGYMTTLTVNIDPVALSLRFTDGYEPRTSTTTSAVDSTPSPTPEPTEEADE